MHPFFCSTTYSVEFAPSRGIQSWILDSATPWIPDYTYRILDSLSMELGFRIQSLEGFRIPGAVFRILKPEISDSTAKISRIPESGYPLRGAISSQKQATDPALYSCNRTNGKFVIVPLKSTCWIISC